MGAYGMTVPERIAKLPKDPRGYPIPWNVLRGDDGTPFFTVNDDRKHWQALRCGLCPICGERLGRWRWWVGGPRSAFDPAGCYLDLPGHHECIQFSLATCPYLAMPKYLGRVDVVHPEKLPVAPIFLDETMIPERPEVFVAVAGDTIEARDRGVLLPYTRPARPHVDYEYWRHGKQITIGEAQPYLLAVLGEDWNEPERRIL
jgi:hypothetical protein